MNDKIERLVGEPMLAAELESTADASQADPVANSSGCAQLIFG